MGETEVINKLCELYREKGDKMFTGTELRKMLNSYSAWSVYRTLRQLSKFGFVDKQMRNNQEVEYRINKAYLEKVS